MLRLILLALLWASTATAQVQYSPFILSVLSGGGACTDGVDCYCDTVSDGSLLLCEDYEHVSFYDETAPNWVSTAGNGAGDRGLGSKWNQLYGNGEFNTVFRNNEPNASPRIGVKCSPSASVCGTREYCSAAQGFEVDGGGSDCWEGNQYAAIDIQRSGDFDAEVGTLTLTGGTGATSDIGAGNQHLAYRTPQSGGGTSSREAAGIVGHKSWTSVTELGVTMLVAYASNIGSVSLIDDYYKHDEYGDYPYSEYWISGNLAPGESNRVFPFRPFMFTDSASDCTAALSTATVNVGHAECNSYQFTYNATFGTGVGQYSQSADWPFGTWGCVQAHIVGMGTTDTDIEIKFNGETIIDIDGIDGTKLTNQDYGDVYFNNYSNANQDPDCNDTCESETTETTYRYQDNVHIRNGAPVSCAAIGF